MLEQRPSEAEKLSLALREICAFCESSAGLKRTIHVRCRILLGNINGREEWSTGSPMATNVSRLAKGTSFNVDSSS